MRTLTILLAASVLLLPAAASAQRANRAISLETGVSLGRSGERAAAALGAAWWLEGDVFVTARVALADAAWTTGREVAGAAGLAWAPGSARLRPRLFAELGFARRAPWASSSGPAAARARVGLGAGAGLEWFVRRDVALTASLAVRGAGGTRAELLGGAAAWF